MAFIKHQVQEINDKEYEYYYIYESYYDPSMDNPTNFKVGKVGDSVDSLVSNLKSKADDKDIDIDQDDIDHFKIQLNTVEAKAKEEGIEEDELGEFYHEAFSGELGEDEGSEEDSEVSKEDQLYDYKIGSVEGWKQDYPRKVTELGWTLEDYNEYGLQIFREETREEDPWTVFAYKEIENGDGQTHPMSREFDSREEAKKFAEKWMEDHQTAEDISVKSDSGQSKNKNFCPEGARNLHGEGFCVVHSEVDPVDIEEAEKVYRETLEDIHPDIPQGLKEQAVDMAKAGADNSVFDTKPFTDEKMKSIDGMIRLYKFIEDNEPVNSSFVNGEDFEKTYITDNLISDSFMVLEMEDFVENPEHYTYVTNDYEGDLTPTNIPVEETVDYNGLIYGKSLGENPSGIEEFVVKVSVDPNPNDSDALFGQSGLEEKLSEPILKGEKVSVKINGTIFDVVHNEDNWSFEVQDDEQDGIDYDILARSDLDEDFDKNVSDTVVGIEGGIVTVDSSVKNIETEDDSKDNEDSDEIESFDDLSDEKLKEMYMDVRENKYFQRFVEEFKVDSAYEVLIEDGWDALSEGGKRLLTNGDDIPKNGLSQPYIAVADQSMVVLFTYAPSGFNRHDTNLRYEYEAKFFMPLGDAYITGDITDPDSLYEDYRSMFSKDYLQKVRKVYSDGFKAYSGDDFPAFFSPVGSNKTSIVLAPRIEEE